MVSIDSVVVREATSEEYATTTPGTVPAMD
jgi:hypothetical protein